MNTYYQKLKKLLPVGEDLEAIKSIIWSVSKVIVCGVACYKGLKCAHPVLELFLKGFASALGKE